MSTKAYPMVEFGRKFQHHFAHLVINTIIRSFDPLWFSQIFHNPSSNRIQLAYMLYGFPLFDLLLIVQTIKNVYNPSSLAMFSQTNLNP